MNKDDRIKAIDERILEIVGILKDIADSIRNVSDHLDRRRRHDALERRKPG